MRTPVSASQDVLQVDMLERFHDEVLKSECSDFLEICACHKLSLSSHPFILESCVPDEMMGRAFMPMRSLRKLGVMVALPSLVLPQGKKKVMRSSIKA